MEVKHIKKKIIPIHYIYMSRQSKYTIELEKTFGEKLPDKKKTTLSKFFNIPIKYLDEIYDRGRMIEELLLE